MIVIEVEGHFVLNSLNFLVDSSELLRRRESLLLDPPPHRINETQHFETSEGSSGGLDLGWLPAFPHALMASTANFIFGYHIGYMFTFGVGAGPDTGLIIPALSNSRTRAEIMGFSFSIHWVCNFLVGLYFLELVKRFGVAPVDAAFGGVSLLAAVFTLSFIVETKDRSLEEIELSLSPGLPDQKGRSE